MLMKMPSFTSVSFLASIVLHSWVTQAATEVDHFDRVIDVANNYDGHNYTLPIKSTAYSSSDELLNVSISVINGRCRHPKLSLTFEEIDFDQEEEYFVVYYAAVSDATRIANCSGRYRECDVFSQCIDRYPLPVNATTAATEAMHIFIVKSAEVNPFCSGYSMNLNLTIACDAELYHEWHTMPAEVVDQSVGPLYGHIAAYHAYDHTLTVIGGVNSSYIHSRVVTPYPDADALNGELTFAVAGWQSRALYMSLPTYSGLFCLSQCHTQVSGEVYMFGPFGALTSFGDGGYGVLLRYDLSTTAWTSWLSAMRLNHACVANNGTHVLIVGGVDDKSKVAYHNIQAYDISADAWNTNLQSLYIPRSDAGCAVVRNILYVIGGWIDGVHATDTIETVALDTLESQLLSVVLQDGRAEHNVAADNDLRLWIIGGRGGDSLSAPNVEILDTVSQTMLSTENAVRYSSTVRHALYSAPWFDAANDIMFVSGGMLDHLDAMNGNSSRMASDEVQYLDVNVLGTDAFPTAPPTLPPVPTPYPTPVGHAIGWNETFDMRGYTPSDSVTFTQTIQSSEELSTDSFFYVNFRLVNGICSNASLSFQFEEIDFAESATEYIDVFSPRYPTDLVAHCTGTNDRNCGQWLSCLSHFPLADDAAVLDTSDGSYNYAITVAKAPEINAYCSTLSINARVSLHCGARPPPTETPTMEPTVSPTTPAPTSLYTNITHSYYIAAYDVNETVSFTIPVQSAVDNHIDTLFKTEFVFTGVGCRNPRLSFVFEEVDFQEPTEYIELYYESYPSSLIQRCLGAKDSNCGHFVNCTDLLLLSPTTTDAVSIILLKSAEVNRFCSYALNANVTITCGPIATTTTTAAPTASTTSANGNDNASVIRQFDLLGITENDTVSFTIPVQSAVDDNTDVLFSAEFVFLNGECHRPLLTLDFEEIDFAQSYEYIDVYFPSYFPPDLIQRCQGTQDRNCGTSIRCVDLQPLTLTNNTNTSITIWLLKSGEVNQLCDFSLNANVTIHCGAVPPTKPPTFLPSHAPTLAPTPMRLNFSQTFDLSTLDETKLFNSYSQNIQSTVDEDEEAILNVTFRFTNGVCSTPYLSVAFEEIDFAEDDEYLEIRYPSNEAHDAIAQCQGREDYNCGHWEQCLSFYDLAVFNVSSVSDEITLFVVKSGEVNAFCTNSVNVNVTIACVTAQKKPSVEQNVTCPPTPICTPAPTASMTTTGTTAVTTQQSATIDIATTETLMSTSTLPIATTASPVTTSVDCGKVNAIGTTAAAAANGEDEEDKLMTYLPWILFAVSVFGNLLLLIGVVKARKNAAFVPRRRGDVTQMVTMESRAGLMDNFGDFQEVTSNASVDYVNINAA